MLKHFKLIGEAKQQALIICKHMQNVSEDLLLLLLSTLVSLFLKVTNESQVQFIPHRKAYTEVLMLLLRNSKKKMNLQEIFEAQDLGHISVLFAVYELSVIKDMLR